MWAVCGSGRAGDLLLTVNAPSAEMSLNPKFVTYFSMSRVFVFLFSILYP